MKRLPSSLREKKRYVAFSTESDEPLSRDVVIKEIWNHTLGFLGERQASDLNLRVLEFDENKQEGFLVCSHKRVGEIKACLGLIGDVNNNRAHTRVLGTSGTIKSLRRKFLSRKAQFKKEDKEAFFLEKIKIVRSCGERIDVVFDNRDLTDRLKRLKIRYIGLIEKDVEEKEIGGKKDATST